MLEARHIQNALTSACSSLANWWQSVGEQKVDAVVDYSAENRLALSGITVGLATTGLLVPPLQLLATPSLLLLALPAYKEAITTWRQQQKLSDAVVEASLLTLFVATNHLALGAAGMLLLAAGQRTADNDDSAPTLALGILALPVAGLSGAAATLYARTARQNPRHLAQQRLQEHDILVKNWGAAQQLPSVDTAIIDQSCLVQPKLKAIHAFRHYMQDEVRLYAATVAPPPLKAQLQPFSTAEAASEIEVRLLTPNEVKANGLIAPAMPEDWRHLFVVVNGRIIGALEIDQTPIPAARLLLEKVQEADLGIVLISEQSADKTQSLASAFGIKRYVPNLSWQQKVEYCQQQQAACIISRTPLAVSTETTVTLSLENCHPNTDITLNEEAFDALFHAMQAYRTQRPLRQLVATIPTVLTIGGVFFLQWGVPAALSVQGVSLAANYFIDRRFRQMDRRLNTVDATPDQAVAPALSVPAM